jgi:hypothetical protein
LEVNVDSPLRSQFTCPPQQTYPSRRRSQVPPLFDKEETRERLRKLPGGASQPLTVRRSKEPARSQRRQQCTSHTGWLRPGPEQHWTALTLHPAATFAMRR